MNSSQNDRRRLSQLGTLDSALRMLGQLASSKDMATRSLANRTLAELSKLRRGIPQRRHTDSEGRYR